MTGSRLDDGALGSREGKPNARGPTQNVGLKAWLFLIGLVLLVAPDLARAQPYDVPDTWGEDIWSRPRL
jgi:hypothetical protein